MRAEFAEMVEFFGHRCVRCGEEHAHFDRDHIVPHYQGGASDMRNMQPLCARCNAQKGPENIDHRIAFCAEHGLTIPSKWVERP